MALVTDEAEHAGLELVLVLALLNIAWSPGQLIGSTGSGALASATGDSVPYLLIGALCLVSLALVARLMRTKERLVATGARPTLSTSTKTLRPNEERVAILGASW